MLQIFWKLKPFKTIFILCGLLAVFSYTSVAFSAPIKVGVYENNPLVFSDAEGAYQGLFIDLLNHIAKQESWQLEFVPGSWSECLQRLKQGEIDLQLAIAVTEERKKLYDYPEQAVFNNWGRLYRHPAVSIDSILDLNGKTIAMVEADIHGKVFSSLMKKFGEQFTPLYFKEYDQVLEKVQSGEADVGVINRTYAMQNEHRYKVETTPMIFNPIEVSNATLKGHNGYILEAFDRHLPELLQDRGSIYYQSLEKWFSQGHIGSATKIPAWLITSLIIAVTLLLLIIAVSMLLKQRIRQKTAELEKLNQQLSTQVNQLQDTKRSLRDSEEKFRTILNNQNDAVFLHQFKSDGVSPFAEVNDIAVERYGYSREELLQLCVKDIDASVIENQKRYPEIRNELLNNKFALFESVHIKKNGEQFPVEVSSTVIEIQGKQFILSTARDISERKVVEQKLVESEEKYRTLLNNQSDAIFLHKLQNEGFANFSEVNAVAVERYGYSYEEFAQLGPPDITLNSDSQKHATAEARRRLMDEGHVITETVHVKKSGQQFPVEINAVIVEIQGEKYILATVRDISERKQAELERQLNNERFMTVLNSIDAGIYVADMESYEILFMNKFLIEEYGQDFTGKICWDAFRGEPRVCDHCTNNLLIDATGQPTGMQVWQDKNPITGKYYMNYDRAIRWVDGRIVRLQISTDITETKSLETQLRQKYKMEAVGLMAGGIAHDFNNILTIIITNLELAQRKLAADSPLRPRLEQARSASLRATDLVKQILTYSRQGEADQQPIKLSFIVTEALKLQRSITPTSIEIMTQIAPEAHNELVKVDSIQIEEVLINLCTNAVHAMENKGLLTVALNKEQLAKNSLPNHPKVREGDYLVLSVTDTGSGMPEEVLEKIFDPFYTTKPADQGTGMGLAICHGIIEKHKGYITVTSQPGQGSTFAIYLPIADPSQKTSIEKVTDSLPGGDERLLLVDDEEALARSVADFLSEHGYSVDVETDSIKALEMLKTGGQGFDLVITDQTMPELTGVELAEKIKQEKPELPIILCTGYSTTITEAKALESGVSAVYMKPLDLPALTRAIRKLLDEKTN